jgi:hypothetical protein
MFYVAHLFRGEAVAVEFASVFNVVIPKSARLGGRIALRNLLFAFRTAAILAAPLNLLLSLKLSFRNSRSLRIALRPACRLAGICSSPFAFEFAIRFS